MKLSISVLLIFFVLNSDAQKRKFNQPLADSLAKWVVTDQQAATVPAGKLKELSPIQLDRFKDSIFNTHQILLSKIFNKYGYPGYDLVGQKGSNNFWLMVQHCDKFPEFQRAVLAKMQTEVASQNADPQNFAYLTDRVNVNAGKKQVYATQLTYNTDSCQAIPKPLIDSAGVNSRRQKVGLPPVEEYLNMMSELHFNMNKASYEKKGIHKAKLLKVPTSI